MPSWASTPSLILCFLRHLSEEAAFATLEQALPYAAPLHRRRPGQRASAAIRRRSSRACSRAAAQLGLHVVAHAGEEGRRPTSGAALDVLKVERIDHGVRCVEDPALVQRLARGAHAADGVPAVERQAVRVQDLAEHNLAGTARCRAAVATVNSDDPACFGGYVSDNLPGRLRRCHWLGAPGLAAGAQLASTPSFADRIYKAALACRAGCDFFQAAARFVYCARCPDRAPGWHNAGASFRRRFDGRLHGAIISARPRRCSGSSACCWSRGCWSSG